MKKKRRGLNVIRIFENIDCMEGMEKYKDLLLYRKTLAIVDPEFGIGISKSPRLVLDKGLDAKDWDDKPVSPEYFNILFSISNNQIIWGGNYYALPGNKHCVIWDKKQPEGLSFGMFDYAWTSFVGSNKMFRGSAVQTGDETKIHECQKPIALYKWLLENYAICKECDGLGYIENYISLDCDVKTCPKCKGEAPLILDTHVGSASSLIACEEFGIDYVGFELDPDYYQAAKERLEKARFIRENKAAKECYTDDLELFKGVK